MLPKKINYYITTYKIQMERGRDEPAEAMSFYCHWKNMEIWVGTKQIGL
jgi:hypothetical protein